MGKRFLLAEMFLIAAAGCSSNVSSPMQSSPQDALARGDFAGARRLAAQIPRDDPRWPDAQLVLGELAMQSGDANTVRQIYAAIPRDGSSTSVAAARSTARIEESQGRLHDAIQAHQYVVEHDPHDRRSRGSLANLYAATGQRRLADGHLAVLVKSPDFAFKPLVLLTDFERLDPNGAEFLERCAESAPDDPAVKLGLAVHAVSKGEWSEARSLLEQAVDAVPELAAAQGLLGELLLDAGEQSLARWYEGVPSTVRNEPEVLYALGLWAHRSGRDDIAARSLWEAARQMPTSYRALHQLGIALNQSQPELGQAVAQRAATMYDFRQTLSKALNTMGKDQAAMRRVIELLLEMGRDWEAWSWSVIAEDRYPRAPWVAQVRARLPTAPAADVPRIRPSADLLAKIDLSHLPDPSALFAPRASIAARELARRPIAFVDRAAELGVDFTYHCGRVEGAPGVRMQESTGGGIAALDYDLDGWPDLFFTQGEDWPLDSDVPSPSATYRDRLFRNIGTGFVEMTDAAGIFDESGYGQGCSAGDFNNDGFVDLYVANIGRNQLLINQGDGTFLDVTESLGLTTSAWTSSCLIADLNDDGFPDLFDVNYLEGEGLYRRLCNENECTPLAHQTARDHVHLSNGDGTVRPFDIGGEGRWGAGLGMVAFRAEDSSEASSRRLSLFIANDHEPNFFLANTPAGNADHLALSDLAFLKGLAVNMDGKPMACMGVASGDLNGDGLLDLFVTNYKGEANNLYLQSPGGYFSDGILGTGLVTPGLPYVGWGAQCLDADNDGRLDLVIANGHVGDFHQEGLECYFPTQFFYNEGGNRFAEPKPDDIGPFFAKKLLGRSVATLDWNRDGLTDFVVSPIADAASLLTNRTPDAGHYLAIRLHAVTTARDALGTIVTVTTSAGESRQQLTAGDGYQATNERVLRFGLGGQAAVERMVIEWPSGLEQTIEQLTADRIIDLAEGHDWR